MVNFCTLFDSNYIHYGLCLHASLIRHCPDFHLYVFAFDDKCHQLLTKMALKNVTVIALSEFEDQALLDVKPQRTKGEYCWTCTPSVIRYVLKNYSVESCTYIDSDLYFYSDPTVLLEEMGSASVSIIEHRYHPDYDQTEKSGKYCVQFMTFMNNEDGMNVLEWWRDACIDWCFNRFEDGKFGDQKYLDDWVQRFADCVCELHNEGGGVAPWNVRRYSLIKRDNEIFIKNNSTEEKVVFYHFHGFCVFNKFFVRATGKLYFISMDCYALIYKPYMQEMKNAIRIIENLGHSVYPEFRNEISLIKKIKIIFGYPDKNIYSFLLNFPSNLKLTACNLGLVI